MYTTTVCVGFHNASLTTRHDQTNIRSNPHLTSLSCIPCVHLKRFFFVITKQLNVLSTSLVNMHLPYDHYISKLCFVWIRFSMADVCIACWWYSYSEFNTH